MDLRTTIKQQAAQLRAHKLTQGLARNGDWQFRLHLLRREARATLLAYAFTRGRAYKRAENNARQEPDFLVLCAITMAVLGWDPEDYCNIGGRRSRDDERFDAQRKEISAWIAGTPAPKSTITKNDVPNVTPLPSFEVT